MRPRDPIKPSEPNPGDAALSNAVRSASSDNSASAMFSGHLESSGPLESAGFAEPSAASTGHLESPASSESANESFGSGSTVLKSRLPIFSALVLIAITTLAMVAYSYSARKINEAYVERQLLFASQTLKMLLYSLVDGELALMLKLADTDVTRDYLRSPFDAKLEKAAREKFEGFNRFLRNGALFWSSAVDRRLFSMTDPTRQIPFGEPDSEWYDFTMKSGQPFFITVGPNIFTGRDTVWLNVPVLDADSEKRPLGLLGSGIELDLWLREAELAFQCLDPQLNWYLFGSDGRIITAANAGFGGLKASIFEELGDIKTELGHAAEGVRPRGPFLKDRNLYQITYIENFNWLLVVKYTLPDLIALNLPFNIMFFSMFLIFFFIIFSFNIFIRKADIELAEGRQSLLLANRKAEKASRAKSMMLAIVSHELRTPLNAIIGVSRLILREDTSKTVRESVLSVKQAGDSAMALITDLLDLSRIEAGHFEVATKPYWLGSLVQDVITIIRLRLSDTNLSLVVKIEPTLPARLSGDEIRLRRVLLNLMSNAVKYTQEGHVSLSIRRGDDPLDLAGNPSFAPEETTLASSKETASPSPKETVSLSPPDVSKTADESKEAPIESLSSPKIQTNQKAMALQNDQTCAEGQTIRLVLEVADSGVGIKEKDLAQLFDSFIRLDREINQDIEGSGLGLAIAKRLTESMYGEIAVSSI